MSERLSNLMGVFSRFYSYQILRNFLLFLFFRHFFVPNGVFSFFAPIFLFSFVFFRFLPT